MTALGKVLSTSDRVPSRLCISHCHTILKGTFFLLNESLLAVMGHWNVHVPNPNTSLPGPDFRKMDKAATARGLQTAKEFKDYRKDHPATLRRGNSARKEDTIPSDLDPTFTYGRPSVVRLTEEVSGPLSPPDPFWIPP